jgi:hypothetical protein
MTAGASHNPASKAESAYRGRGPPRRAGPAEPKGPTRRGVVATTDPGPRRPAPGPDEAPPTRAVVFGSLTGQRGTYALAGPNPVPGMVALADDGVGVAVGQILFLANIIFSLSRGVEVLSTFEGTCPTRRGRAAAEGSDRRDPGLLVVLVVGERCPFNGTPSLAPRRAQINAPTWASCPGAGHAFSVSGPASTQSDRRLGAGRGGSWLPARSRTQLRDDRSPSHGFPGLLGA